LAPRAPLSMERSPGQRRPRAILQTRAGRSTEATSTRGIRTTSAVCFRSGVQPWARTSALRLAVWTTFPRPVLRCWSETTPAGRRSPIPSSSPPSSTPISRQSDGFTSSCTTSRHRLPATGLSRWGTVAASHDNARKAFDRGAPVLVYPGGDYEHISSHLALGPDRVRGPQGVRQACLGARGATADRSRAAIRATPGARTRLREITREMQGALSRLQEERALPVVG
jgi:hypothetical protein